SSLTIKNTIIAFNTRGGGIYVDLAGSQYAKLTISYADIYGNSGDYIGWPNQTGKNGNISKDPLFAWAAKGNFYEKSKGGRWNLGTKTWVIDTVHSPCIDAGAPASPFANEPSPNGGRTNMGAYGNTKYASKSAPKGAASGLLLTATAASTGSGSAQITVNLTSAATVQVSVLNLAGREVAVLPEEELDQGVSTLLWNGRSSSGTRAPAGRYLVRVTARSDDGGQSQALAGLSLGR
ncbi:MAG: FlgD immunoglobulin-like domain containing protein, partial [Armatimonadota bacterium]